MLFAFTPLKVLAEGEIVAQEVVIEATPSSEYSLPYPGILPDHPLYFLKQLRDKVYDFFTRDPVRKTEFKLLMADKRMNMALMLSEKGNNSLAVDTIVDAVAYYNDSVSSLLSISQSQTNTNELQIKLFNAVNAYQPIIVKYMQSVDGVDAVDAEKLTDAYNIIVAGVKSLPRQ